MEKLPDSFVATREALHRVAEEIVAPARKPHNEIALRPTSGGFGTPEFEFEGDRLQVRVEGVDLVLARGGDVTRAPLTSLADAGVLLGPKLLPDGLPTDDAPLGIDPAAAAVLADFYDLARRALAGFESSLPEDAAASDTNLWPEHFDLAFEAGAEDAGMRANFGASPGDELHAKPYLYVGPWTAEVEGELWDATGFTGAELDYADLLAADDAESAAVDFFRSRFETLAAG
ncbi:MAG: hypothetical protein ACRDK1_00550 [Solirubrobacterales bacterium]